MGNPISLWGIFCISLSSLFEVGLLSYRRSLVVVYNFCSFSFFLPSEREDGKVSTQWVGNDEKKKVKTGLIRKLNVFY